MNNHSKKHHWFGLATALWVGLFAGAAGAQTGLIGGRIWTGATAPGGGPLYEGNAPIYDAQVMIETADEEGRFVAYANVRENSWEAELPVGDYVVMFSAPGYDCTSRFLQARPGLYVSADAYLAPLPLPSANLLVYAFMDNKINGEDDFPTDWGLRGVTFHVVNERGLEVAVGVSGSEPQNLPPLPAGDPNGLYYFTGLEPGVYDVWADSSTAPAHEGGTSDYYLTSTEEGTPSWEAILKPGDDGMEDGIYLLWYGYVPKLDQLPLAPGTGTITGLMLDADGNDPEEPFPFEGYPLVTPNIRVPDGVVLLQSLDESLPVKVMATTEADPVTGEFGFQNVPAGKYKILCFDLPLDYVWSQLELTVTAGGLTYVEPLSARFFARVQGFVLDKTSMRPAGGAEVRLRLMDGRVWKKTTVDSEGWYNFNSVEEVEVIGFVDVKPPPDYRGARRAGDRDSKLGRLVQWYTYNYRADMDLVPISPSEGDIGGFVFYDSLAPGTWAPNGVWDETSEATLQGATVNLYDGANNLIAATQTGTFDKTLLLSQGWLEPGTYPPDEIGNVYEGPILGRYEFTGLAPGWYRVKVVMPDGFFASPAGSNVDSVEVVGGLRTEFDRGMATLVPRTGHIEGGVFDDVTVDYNRLSLLWMEKAGIPHAPVGIYDHLGYLLGVGHMGNPLCYAGSIACPPGEAPIQKPEMLQRIAPGVHEYLGNDPTQVGYDPHFFPMPLAYYVGQGTFKFEADWSLVPIGGGAPAHGLDRSYHKLNKLWDDLAAWQTKQAEAEAALLTANALPRSTKAQVRASKKAVRKARKAVKRASKKTSKLKKKIAKLERKIDKRRAR